MLVKSEFQNISHELNICKDRDLNNDRELNRDLNKDRELNRDLNKDRELNRDLIKNHNQNKYSLRTQSDEELLVHIKQSVLSERKITQIILDQLREVDRRMIYAKMGYSSLFDFCLKYLGYSESAAYRRITAMRLIRDMPELKLKMQENKVNLTTLSQLQSFIARVEKNEKKKLPVESRRFFANSIENKNQKQCERTFVGFAPLLYKFSEKEKLVTSELTEVKFYADAALSIKIKRAREILSHVDCKMSYADMFNRLLDDFLRRSKRG